MSPLYWNSEENQGTFRSKFLYQRRGVRFTCILNPTPLPPPPCSSNFRSLSHHSPWKLVWFFCTDHTNPHKSRSLSTYLCYLDFLGIFHTRPIQRRKKKQNKWFVHELNISVISWWIFLQVITAKAHNEIWEENTFPPSPSLRINQTHSRLTRTLP